MTGPGRLLQLHGVVVDLIYRVDAVPSPGGEAIVRAFESAPGGGFNAMVSARRTGMDVTYAGGLGAGPFGDLVIAGLRAERIDALRRRDTHRDQGCCTVMIDSAGERTFVAAEGAEGHLTDADFEGIDFGAYDFALLSGYSLYYKGSGDALTRLVDRETGLPPLVFDPAPVIGAVPVTALEPVMRRAAWISANAAEAAILTGSDDPETAARTLAASRPKGGGAVIRLGAGGAVLAWDGQVTAVDGFSVDTIDTNGAGDTHIGAFIAALARGEAPARAVQVANAAAALSTTKHGPATAPDLTELEQLLHRETRAENIENAS